MTVALTPTFANAATEPTEAGEQLLAPFVAPVSVRERLAHLMAQPLAPRKPKSLSTSGSEPVLRPA
jgi:hypothetical protein